MSVAERAYFREMKTFRKRFGLPLRKVADMMPFGFSDDDFYSTFKRCFHGLWEEIVEKKAQYDLMDKERIRKHQRPIHYFPNPDAFLQNRSRTALNIIRAKHKQGQILSDEERLQLQEKYELRSKKRQAEKNAEIKRIEQYQQFVTPDYTNFFIKAYFKIKHNHPEDVNTRMRILQEAAKFKCKETVSFLFKVNASERNFHLREFAFRTLQKEFGFPQIHLHRNRKGKKRLGDDVVPKLLDTPESLMAEIHNSQFDLERHKSFDVFLSHSSVDKKDILRLKTLLNTKNLSVYIDWIEDRDSLRRELTNADTARVIIERIKHTKAVLYVQTESSVLSLWTSWELGYASALGKKICVLPLEYILNLPAYLDIYDRASLLGDDLFVDDQDEVIPIELWINKIKQNNKEL